MDKCSKCKEILNNNNCRIGYLYGEKFFVRRCIKCEDLTAVYNYNAKRFKKRKIELIKLMGGKCMCCGVTEWWNLTLDHIIPISKTKSKRLETRTLIIEILKNPELLDNLQLLCFGCNTSKNNGTKCKLFH